jgi:hypothetical protein
MKIQRHLAITTAILNPATEGPGKLYRLTYAP